MCPWPRYICWLQTRPNIVSRRVVDRHIDSKIWCNIDHSPYCVWTTDIKYTQPIARVVPPPANCQYLQWLLIELIDSIPFKFMNVVVEHCIASHCICALPYFNVAKYFIALYFGESSEKLLNMWDWLWTRHLYYRRARDVLIHIVTWRIANGNYCWSQEWRRDFGKISVPIVLRTT